MTVAEQPAERQPNLIARVLAKAARAAGATTITDLSAQAAQLTRMATQQQAPFTTSMGPGIPIAPTNPSEGQPRWLDYPVGINIQQKPRASEVVSFATLRALSENYDVARIAIETSIAEMRGLDWDFIPKAVRGQTRKQASERSAALRDQITAAQDFFSSPDKRVDFGTWIGKYLDDMLSIDAPTIYGQMTNGGDLHSLDIIDGATIRPIIDLYGNTPDPPEPAYGQVIKGMTWGLYTRDELLYSPFRARPNSLYGYPPLEWVMLTVNRALRRQTMDLSLFTEGTMPVSFYKMPEGWTGQQLQELQDILDAILAGNDVGRSRVRLMPGGTGTGLERVHNEPRNDVEEWLMTVTAAAFGTTPTELGFQPRGIGLGGKGFQESQEAINYRKKLRPIGRHIKYQLDWVLEHWLHMPELEFQWTGLIEEADQYKQAQTDQLYWEMGVYSTDYLAERQGVDPPGLGHILAYNGTIVPVQSLIAQFGEYDRLTTPGGPTDESELPGSGVVPDTTPAGPATPDGTSGVASTPSTTATITAPTLAKSAMIEDLARWRRKALRAGRAVPFASDLIPSDEAARIAARLAVASSPDDIRAAFDDPLRFSNIAPHNDAAS